MPLIIKEILVGSSNHNISCLKGQTGNIKWSYTAPGAIITGIAIGDVNGNGDLEVIAAAFDNNRVFKKLWFWK